MSLHQIKKSTLHILFSFLILVLLGSNINVQAGNIEKSDLANTLWEQGKNAFSERDYSAALEKFNNCLTIYRKNGDLQLEADILTWLAVVSVDADMLFDAKIYMTESQTIYEKLKSSPGKNAAISDVKKAMKALALFAEGSSLKKARNYESALEKYQNALELVREIRERRYEADVLVLMGVVLHELKNYSKADLNFGYALNIYRELGEKWREGKTLVSIAIIDFANEKFPESLIKIDAALKIFEEINDKEGMAYAFNWAGRINYSLNEFVTASEYYKKALVLYEESGSKKEQALIAKWLGLTYKVLALYDISIKYFKEALGIIQEIGIDPQEGFILMQIGETYRIMGDYLNALNAYNNAMQIFKGNNSLIQQGSALVGIGRAHSGLGNYLEAIENLQKALEIFENLNESQDLNGHIRLGHKNVLYALSEVHALMGSNEKAREFDLKIRNLSQWNKNNKLGQFLNLINQGQNCEKRSNFEKALKKYQQAFSLSRETSNKQCEAMSLEYIGNIYKELKKYPNAIKYYLDALALDREQKYIIGELSVLKGIAYIYMIQSDFTNALVCYQQALKKAKETGSNIFEIDALGGVGLSSNALKDYKTAEVYYKEALIKSKELDVPGKIWRYNYRLGTLAQVSGHYQEAKCYYSEAIDVIESVREKISLEEYKTSFVENKINVYRNMITVLLLLKEDKEAFNYVERAKSRSFLDLLGNRLNLKRGKDKKLSQVEMQLQKKISKLLEKIRNEQALPKEKQRVVLSIWNEELMKARKRYSEILLEIRREAPELHSLVSVNPLSLKEIQVLIDPDTTLLAYYLYHYTVNGKKDYIVLCWVINKRESFLCSTERVSGLPSKIKILREKITNLQSDYDREAKELYNLLIKPLKQYIKTKRICIIPHSVLHYLPFQALIDTDYTKDIAMEDTHFLLEEYDIFYSPSASVLKFILEKRKGLSGKVLAFGNPELEDKGLDLPHAEKEVNSIKQSYPETSIYLKDKATEEKAKQLSGEYGIIHFASHGELSPQSPLFSCIKMAKDKNEDGRLEVHEIFNLDLENTSLVTLSACQTGLGKLSRGDELIGLTRAFIYAGTPSVVASLWSVNDQSTSDLMSLFYKNLKTHSKVEALRMAQLEMINGEAGRGIVRGIGGIASLKEGEASPQSQMTVNGSHPYFWAPFILLGDWN